MVDGGLRHAVDRLARERHLPGLGAEVDDRPAALADHGAADGLADEEGAFEIDRTREVEISLGHVLGSVLRAQAGVVDKDVDRTGCRKRLVDGVCNLVELRHVHLHADGTATEPLDLAGDPRRTRSIAQAKHDICAGVGKGERDRLAEAACGAGDEGDAAAEIEARESDIGGRHVADRRVSGQVAHAAGANWPTCQSRSRQVSDTCVVPNARAGASASTSSKPHRS
jgi:hypothetical protein